MYEWLEDGKSLTSLLYGSFKIHSVNFINKTRKHDLWNRFVFFKPIVMVWSYRFSQIIFTFFCNCLSFENIVTEVWLKFTESSFSFYDYYECIALWAPILYPVLSVSLLSEEFVISSVLSCRNKNLKQLDRPALQPLDRPVLQLCVTAQFYLQSKGKYILEAWGHANPKDMKRIEAPAHFWVLFLYVFFSSSWACPM